MTVLKTLIVDSFDSGTLNSTRWPVTGVNTGGAITIASGGLRLDHNWNNDFTGWPPPRTEVYSAAGEIANSDVFARLYPLLASDAGAGNAHKANSMFAVMNQANLEGFGFVHVPANGTNGALQCKIFNNINDEWWVDVGTVSSYNPNGDHAWLRCRQAGTTFYWDTAPDNGSGAPGTWTNRFSYSTTGSGVSFDSMSGFLGTGGARIHFRTYHWENTYQSSYVTQAPRIDGVNGTLVGTVTHSATGALVGPGAAITGSAARTRAHSSSGALVGPGASVAGSAARKVTHTSSGALVGPGAAVTGAARLNPVVHSATGVLVAQGAIVTGAAMRANPVTHTSSGALVGQAGFVSGQATRSINPSKVASVQDHFDGTVINARWTHQTINGATGSVTQSGGRLRFNLQSNFTGAGLLCYTPATKDFTGSEIFWRVPVGLAVAGNGAGAEFIMGLESSLADSGFSWHQHSDGTIRTQWRISGTSDAPTAHQYTPSQYAWLRLKEASGVVYWQRAPSSAQDPPLEAEWITVYQRPRSEIGNFDITSMRIRMLVNYWGGAPGLPVQPPQIDAMSTRTTAVVTHAATGALVGSGAALAGTAAIKREHVASGALVGPGAAVTGGTERRFEHTATGALVGQGAIILSTASASDVTRKVWSELQDTGGAWSEQPQDPDPWTPTPDSGGAWGS